MTSSPFALELDRILSQKANPPSKPRLFNRLLLAKLLGGFPSKAKVEISTTPSNLPYRVHVPGYFYQAENSEYCPFLPSAVGLDGIYIHSCETAKRNGPFPLFIKKDEYARSNPKKPWNFVGLYKAVPGSRLQHRDWSIPGMSSIASTWADRVLKSAVSCRPGGSDRWVKHCILESISCGYLNGTAEGILQDMKDGRLGRDGVERLIFGGKLRLWWIKLECVDVGERFYEEMVGKLAVLKREVKRSTAGSSNRITTAPQRSSFKNINTPVCRNCGIKNPLKVENTIIEQDEEDDDYESIWDSDNLEYYGCHC